MSTTTIIPQTGFAHLTDLPCYQLKCGQAIAVISCYGAQLLSYQPEPGVELIYLSPTAVWQNNSPIRGGVPVCWPWFGAAPAAFNPQSGKMPNHGLVRTKMWQVVEQRMDSDAARISFQIEPGPLPWDKAPASLRLCLELTKHHLRLELSADQAMQQAALHSYFAVSGLSGVSVTDLTGPYLDKLNGGQRFDQSEPELVFTQEIDRIYQDTAPHLTVQQGKANLLIFQQGHDASVLWNPWREKAAGFTDLPVEAYQHFICVETAHLNLDTAYPLQLIQQLSYQGQLE